MSRSMVGCAMIKEMTDKIGFLLISQKLFIVRKLTFRSKIKMTKFPAVWFFNELVQSVVPKIDFFQGSLIF